MTGRLLLDHVGPQISLQDRGRPGLMRYGIPPSGPMARICHRVLSSALGGENLTCIEASLGGLTAIWHGPPVTAAFVGGRFDIALGEQVLAPWSVFEISPGQSLKVKAGKAGAWGYLGLLGDWDVPSWQGSASAHVPSAINGAMLTSGAEIRIQNPKMIPSLKATLPVPDFAEAPTHLDIVMGPQDGFFDPETQKTLLQSPFKVSARGDRMGRRLVGERLPINGTLTMPSEALMRGAVQIAGDLQPTILLADHQTTGGYPKIATLSTASTEKFVQARPGDPIQFRAICVEEAIQSRRKLEREVVRYLAQIPTYRGSLQERLARSNLISGVINAQKDPAQTSSD
ncbi:MAG: biotin-dependent carboxyltransferase family protein [Pseudomonadota bacterium]